MPLQLRINVATITVVVVVVVVVVFVVAVVAVVVVFVVAVVVVVVVVVDGGLFGGIGSCEMLRRRHDSLRSRFRLPCYCIDEYERTQQSISFVVAS